MPGLLTLLPQWVLLNLLKTLQQADTWPLASPGIRVSLFEGIDLTELKRVHSKLLAKFLYR